MHCNLRPPTPRQSFSALITAPCPFLLLIHYSVTWPLTFGLEHLQWRDETLHQIRTQSSNPRRSCCDFNVWPNDLEHCFYVTQLHQTWRGHRAIIAAVQLSFRAWLPCCIFKRWRLKVEWCTFWPFVKITEGVGEISGSINEALPTSLQPNLRNTFDDHPLRGCWARCIGKKVQQRLSKATRHTCRAAW